MSRPGIRFRLTVRRLMAMAMLAAVSLAAFRMNPSLGSFVARVLCLATIRTFRKLDAYEARDMPLVPKGAIRMFRQSTAVATVIIGVSTLALVLGYGLVVGARARPTPPFSPELNPLGVFLGLLLALPTALWLRKKLW